MKKKTKAKNLATVPAWECPKCGTTHPVTVDSCCKNSKRNEGYVPPYMPSNPFAPPIVPLNPYDPQPYFVPDKTKMWPYCLANNR